MPTRNRPSLRRYVTSFLAIWVLLAGLHLDPGWFGIGANVVRVAQATDLGQSAGTEWRVDLQVTQGSSSTFTATWTLIPGTENKFDAKYTRSDGAVTTAELTINIDANNKVTAELSGAAQGASACGPTKYEGTLVGNRVTDGTYACIGYAGKWQGTVTGRVAAQPATPTPVPAAPTPEPEPESHLAAHLSCGNYLEIEVGVPGSPGIPAAPNEPSELCSVIISGFRTNTEDRVEVLPMSGAGAPAELSGLVPGTGITVFPGGVTSEWPPNMNRPEHSMTFLINTCPQPGICNTAAPVGPVPIMFRVSQQNDPEDKYVWLTLSVNRVAPGARGFPFGPCPAVRNAQASFQGFFTPYAPHEQPAFALLVNTGGVTTYLTYLRLEQSDGAVPRAGGPAFDTLPRPFSTVGTDLLEVIDPGTGQPLTPPSSVEVSSSDFVAGDPSTFPADAAWAMTAAVPGVPTPFILLPTVIPESAHAQIDPDQDVLITGFFSNHLWSCAFQVVLHPDGVIEGDVTAAQPPVPPAAQGQAQPLVLRLPAASEPQTQAQPPVPAPGGPAPMNQATIDACMKRIEQRGIALNAGVVEECYADVEATLDLVELLIPALGLEGLSPNVARCVQTMLYAVVQDQAVNAWPEPIGDPDQLALEVASYIRRCS